MRSCSSGIEGPKKVLKSTLRSRIGDQVFTCLKYRSTRVCSRSYGGKEGSGCEESAGVLSYTMFGAEELGRSGCSRISDTSMSTIDRVGMPSNGREYCIPSDVFPGGHPVLGGGVFWKPISAVAE